MVNRLVEGLLEFFPEPSYDHPQSGDTLQFILEITK